MIATAIPMAESFATVHDKNSFGYKVREFLDRFRENPSYHLLADEPAKLSGILNDNGYADAFLAATAAYLAQKHKLPTPKWAAGSSRALEEPHFAAKSHNLRMVLLQESPAAFRVRNLFVSANALSRA